ncbi:hypothetical protein PLEOSDRAFT_1111305 [Pleurotus ostreatus PC15]|uniref:Prenylcysteine lyase domain-containing protein n=2 Tax=Pleurotus TaxID=5320 RepID=A0A067P3I4_PLEO1|nr:hypothetical protein CCMSSC00406_0000164 [Pleurotus cornucopiae]KDQ30431.1 hypothetical protein PLEOSDRAFT_1111305 [Pleurotus ostreatus PC15]
MKVLTHLCLLIGASNAFEFPFAIPFFSAKVPSVQVDSPPLNVTPRIAIIGAGAGGSSAAFWISKAKERFGLDVEVDVYEQSSYIGGRSTVVYPHDDASLPHIELGASIFVNANKNMWRASEEFNLTRDDFSAEDNDLGVWDGENILLSFAGGWWDTLKLMWRYGVLSPKRAQTIVDRMVAQFQRLYSDKTLNWDNIQDIASSFGWDELVAQTASEYLQSKGITRKYAHEFVEATTRVNYGQNADFIHMLGGAVGLAATGAVGIKGGNFLVFEQFLKRSGANVHLNTTVLSITHHDSSHDWTVETTSGTKRYRGVILAAPYHSSKIQLPSTLASQIKPQPYVHLHVTLLTTNSSTFNPTYFNLPLSSKVPGMMLTTDENRRQGGRGPEFNSISYHGKAGENEWAVKIFSKERVSDEWLERIFPGSVTWVFRKEWDAYPELPPTDSFPPVKLDTGFYYVNAFEPLMSTMETETISARNIVDLLLNERFGSSICGRRLSAHAEEDSGTSAQAPLSSSNTDTDFVYGWDC